MARIVLQGDPQSLYRLRSSDLPLDRDLRYSFWRWVDFSGFDLSAYRMENMDIIDCQAENVILPDGGRTDYIISRRTDWTGATIPADVSSFNHDLVVEVLRLAPNANHPAVALVRQHVAASYTHSWQDSIYRLRTELGMTNEEILAVFLQAFQGYSRLTIRIREHIGLDLVDATPPVPTYDYTRLRWERLAQRVEEDVDSQVRGFQYDRWASARMLEQLIGQRRGVAPRIYIAQLHPWPAVFAGGDEFPIGDWWKLWWPS